MPRATDWTVPRRCSKDWRRMCRRSARGYPLPTTTAPLHDGSYKLQRLEAAGLKVRRPLAHRDARPLHSTNTRYKSAFPDPNTVAWSRLAASSRAVHHLRHGTFARHRPRRRPEQGITLPGITLVCAIATPRPWRRGCFASVALGIRCPRPQSLWQPNPGDAREIAARLDSANGEGCQPRHHRADRRRGGTVQSRYAVSGIRQLSSRAAHARNMCRGWRPAGRSRRTTRVLIHAGRPYAPKGKALDRARPLAQLPSDDAHVRPRILFPVPYRADCGTSRGTTPRRRPGDLLDPRPRMAETRKVMATRALAYRVLSPSADSPKFLDASNGRVPTAASRTCAWPPRSPRAARLRSRAGSCRAPASSKSRRKRKASIRSSRTPVSSGATPAARCASA